MTSGNCKNKAQVILQCYQKPDVGTASLRILLTVRGTSKTSLLSYEPYITAVVIQEIRRESAICWRTGWHVSVVFLLTTVVWEDFFKRGEEHHVQQHPFKQFCSIDCCYPILSNKILGRFLTTAGGV